MSYLPSAEEFETLFQSDAVASCPWFKFDNIGASCAGVVVRSFKTNPRDGKKGSICATLRAYKNYTIKQKATRENPNPEPIIVKRGEEINVGVPDTSFHQQQLAGLVEGELLEIRFVNETNVGKGNPAKNYQFRRDKPKRTVDQANPLDEF